MFEKSIKSRDKLTLTNANYHSLDLNHSLNNSFLTSSYVVLKDGTKKRKRHVNSYMEEFLEKRRMAAEFAQSKRSTSTKNYRVKLIKNEENIKDAELNVNINIKKMEESININNLKNNLPGTTKELINNSNNIIENNLSKYLNVHTSDDNKPKNKTPSNILSHNKYNNFKRHNIVYSKKTNLSQNNTKNINISNHSFTEDRYNTNQENDEQCNKNINNIKDISPIKQNHLILNAKGGFDEKKIENNKEKEEEKNEKENQSQTDNKQLNNSEHFLSVMEKMINMNINKSQPSPNIAKNEEIKFNNKFKEYEKFLNISDNNIINPNKTNQNEETKDNKDNLNINIDNISNNNPLNLNLNKEEDTTKKKRTRNEEYIVEENDEKIFAYEKEDENENEENEEDDNKNNENIDNDNEEEENEDVERCEVLKGDEDKTKYLKGKKNIITEEIEEVEEGMEINENTSEFPTNKSGRNKNSNRGIIGLMNKNENKDNNEEQKEEKVEYLNIIKEDKKYNNMKKIEIKDLKHKKIGNQNNNTNKNYSFVYSNTSKQSQINIEKNNSLDNKEENNTSNSKENNYLVNISKSNSKEKEGDFNNNEILNINNIRINNDDFNFNKLSDIKNINSEINESANDTNYFNYEKNNKEKEDFIRVINRDIERLEKIRNNNNMINNERKENESYIYEIDNFINLVREKRKSVNNDINISDINYKNNLDYIPPKNILELKKIYKNLNNKGNININIETNYNNNYNNIIQRLNYNKMKLPISKSSSLQSLLNEIRKEKTYNININNININNENQIINNNFFTEKINKEINDSFNNNSEEAKYNDESQKNNFKLFDETKFKKIKETNLRKRNKFRNEFKLKDYETNKNLSHIYLDKVKEDILMNISATKILNKNDINNRLNIRKINYYNNTNIEQDDSEIMPANNIKSLYYNKH